MKVIIAKNPSGGKSAIGTIILWYGNKADIPTGWTYYSAAAGYWVMGASSANTTPQNTTDHTHTYSDETGLAGSHSHSYTLSISAPVNATTPGYFSGGDVTDYWADRNHTNHSQSITVSQDPDHSHPLLTTGSGSPKPPSVGLYYIKRTS